LPLRQISPHISPDDRSLIHGNVSVRVTVSVDPHGSVTDAKPLDIQSPEEKLLAPYAVQAAKLWRFDPARRGGAPVASETVIVFHFGGR
jgi:TonB family protein